MAVHCVGCGAVVEDKDTKCPQCEDPIRGNIAPAPVTVFTGHPPQIPNVCCCCLNPEEKRKTHKFKLNTDWVESAFERRVTPWTSRDALFMPGFLKLSLPWCRKCASTSAVSGFLRGLLYTAAVVGGLAIAYDQFSKSVLGMLAGMFVVPIAGILISRWLVARLPRFRLRGHVPMCMAFDQSLDRDSQAATITFKNYGFTTRWRALNGDRH